MDFFPKILIVLATAFTASVFASPAYTEVGEGATVPTAVARRTPAGQYHPILIPDRHC